ncbi:phage head-tail adaptor [Nitratireductor indicus C115]|uniref:Phage head-tail adaptor n=1 Tax=Nitratireductor indicus C115 TaxID=1231190 RepID=K2MXD2_9HYPH|nr:phage head closure protein [Nitratireductor indicus]EKF39913.1 phage head-tail adaptor [Nitratireductor indicus C115]SFQ81872.1 phage head-tail adaptor, putative, SPP1 family [Nitratireductor indicus]
MRKGGPGALRDRVTFYREVETPDGGGGTVNGWSVIAGLVKVRGRFKPERGSERIEAGRMHSSVAGTLKVRSFALMRTVTAADVCLIDGETYVIRSITNPDRKNEYIEMTIERGVYDVPQP